MNPQPIAESTRERAERAEAVKQAWRADAAPDAAAALDANPDLAADRAVALDLAYEEFCAREEAGEVLDSAAFCARFPFGASLRRLLTLHRFLADHPDALDGVPASWPAVGEAVGDFRLLRELGRGSFSRVYLAVETTAGDRPVALKVSAAGSREAGTLGPLSHPHLTPVLSSRAAGPWGLVAMPYLGTATLEDVVAAAREGAPRSAAVLLDAARRGRHPEDPPFPSCPAFPVRAEMAYADAVAAVAGGLFAAVAYLHARGIAHRDIKPSNVLLGPTGHPYLLDFNLASRAADPWRLAGTLPYMAPEQLAPLAADGAAPPDDARPGDVFALGVVLFELLTGRYPFGDRAALAADPDRGRAAARLAAQQARGPDRRAFGRRVRRSVRAAVCRCLAGDPRERPTAAELAELFARVRPRRRLRSVAPLVAGAGVLALALGYASLRPPARTEAPDPAAEPTRPPATAFERGLALYRQGEHGLAAAEFLAAGKADGDGRAYSYAAYCLAVGRDPVGARRAADEAIRLDHGTAPVYANRAYSHFQAGRLDDAKRDCDTAVGLDPGLPAPRFTRATIHLQLRYRERVPVPAEAVTDIDCVTAATPDSPDAWATAAQLRLLRAPNDPAARDAAVLAVRKAVRAGKSPEAVRENAVFATALAAHPAFGEALATPAPPPPAPPISPHLANPIP